MRVHRTRCRVPAHATATLLAVVVVFMTNACGTTVARDVELGRDALGNTGAVTAGHPLAAEAGLRVLQAGGLAMDAAITAAAMLAVARPHMNGVGGDMFLLYHDSATNLTYALNGSGRSGSAKTLEELQADGLERMPDIGPMSVSVPGAVGGWAEALRRFGTISFDQALQPAIELATAGLPVSERLAEDIAGADAMLRPGTGGGADLLAGRQAAAAG